jgi:hypothetical protein
VALYAIDSLEHNILDWFAAFENMMLQFLREGSGVVYVHCHAGMNRSGFLALAYVCKNYMMPLEAMVGAARIQRPCILQNPVFMDQVKTFIYGHLPGAKDTGLVDIQLDNRNAGLPAPDHRTGPQRLNVDTGAIESGIGRAEIDNFESLCAERPGLGSEGQSAGASGKTD